MKIVALLTGRGNNTLKDKNILPVLGKPLLCYPAEAAKACKEISYFFVSSDDDKILDIAYSLGYVKIKRPKELALPSSKHIETIFHAVDLIKQNGIDPDILVVLLANSATIKSEWIAQGIEMIIKDKSITAAVPVYNEQDHHPYRAKRLNSKGSLEPFFDFKNEEISTNRQELDSCYFLSHNFWILNVKKSLYSKNGQKPWIFLGDNIKPIFTEGCFDVHTLDDLKKSEQWVEENLQ